MATKAAVLGETLDGNLIAFADLQLPGQQVHATHWREPTDFDSKFIPRSRSRCAWWDGRLLLGPWAWQIDMSSTLTYFMHDLTARGLASPHKRLEHVCRIEDKPTFGRFLNSRAARELLETWEGPLLFRPFEEAFACRGSFASTWRHSH